MIHLPHLITDLALILGAAALVTLIFKKLKQPVVLGYIIAGLLVGPNFNLFPTIVEFENIRTWADIGVIFLLFSLGLEFSFKKLIKVGGSALITALIEVGMTMLLGYGLGRILGWNSMDCLFLGGMLAIASTTIIIRAFDELGVKSQKFTGIVMGVLIIEDLVAVVLMVVLSTVAISRTFVGEEMIGSVLKLVFFLVLWFTSGIFFLPTFFKKFRNLMNEETLLIVSLSLCFLMVVLATYAGFSPALGAFIMGSILAETTKAEKIEHIIKPLKNLFGAIFFVSVGMLIDPKMLVQHAFSIIAATLVLLLGKPFFVTVGALISGQPLRISVQSGMSLSQIGEFSFIIATLGLSLNVTSDFLYPVAVAVSVVTTFTTPYMIRLSEPFYNMVVRKLPITLVYKLNRYSSNIHSFRNESEWKVVLRSYAIIMGINSIAITGLILLSSRFLTPYISAKIDNALLSNILTAIVTILCMTPFLLGLALRKVSKGTDHNLWLNQRSNRTPLIILEISRMALAIFLIGFMLNQLFSSQVAFIVALAIIVVIIIVFYKHLQIFYALIERRFMSNLNARELENKGKSVHDILPWDVHLTEFEIKAESFFIGKTLLELAWRENFGINIARIERGQLSINIPKRDERLYPGDILSVIGTDEQLTEFRKVLETSVAEIESTHNHKVVLEKFIVSPISFLTGKTIRESGIREETNGLIVGIERQGNRILNPESTTIFSTNDLIWIVGEPGIAQFLKNKKN